MDHPVQEPENTLRLFREEMEEERKREAKQRIEEAKDKVRALAAAVDPSPILLAAQVDELARMAARVNHPDTSVFVSLAREIERFSDKIDVPFTCLKVLGGRDGDIVGAVVAKQLKAALKKESDKKDKVKEEKHEQRPGPAFPPGFSIPYPPYMAPPEAQGQFPYLQGYNQWNPPMQYGSYNPPPYSRQRGRGRQGGSGGGTGRCHFCDQPGHYQYDCKLYLKKLLVVIQYFKRNKGL